MNEIHTLSIEDSVALRQATAPAPSPDGRQVAFCVSSVSIDGEHAAGTICLVPSDGSTPALPFTSGNGLDSAPRWSPDGRHLAFLSDRHERGTLGLYVMPADGGEARRLLLEPGEASNPRWSPDGRLISVLLKETETEEEKTLRVEKRDDAMVMGRDKLTRLWLVDARDGRTRCLSPAGMNVWQQAWSPDGRCIAVLHSPSPQVNDAYSSYRLGTLTLDEKPILTDLCPLYGDTVTALCWSHGGRTLAVVGPADQRPYALSSTVPLIISASGGAPTAAVGDVATEFNWVDWLSDQELVATGDEGTASVYYRLTPGGDCHPLFPSGHPAGAARELALNADRTTLAFTREDTTSPGDLWAVKVGGEPIRLTTLNPELGEMAWGAVERVCWSAPDGLQIEGLLIKPVDYQPGRRYPTVVHVHGGPAWLWGDRFYASWHDWDQFLAARGYAVLLPNPRGSTGRGTAFVRGNYDDFGGGEWRDILAGARWAIESGIADPERLGLGGWSWGGYLTAWGITQTDLFKAAVVGAGCTNLVSDHGLNDCPDMNRLYFPDLPYADATPYWERSPLKHVARVTTPTLILHGERDEIVALPQAKELYRALKTMGVPAQLVIYPREPHSIQERAHQLDLLRRVLDWFDTYLRAPEQ
jgi:dipeptidyl aminopeptidase/acylaminoacyl peptidase